MAGKVPRPAFVEDWDDTTHEPIPESQREANIGAKVASNRLDPRFHEPIDGASDSGYSSRTAATFNSTQSGPSGGKSPPGPLKQLDGPNRDIVRKPSSRKERKEKERRPAREERMMGYHHHAPVVQNKPRRRDSLRHSYQPEIYYEGAYQYPLDSRRTPNHGPAICLQLSPAYAGRHPYATPT
ncbi:hypothetical protein N7468_008560 [Penicillium chermesinum]|uniref:Uncharacterized protein n=1 Tax=Penicillium chermesinum TaxID=63820 RepID=A0A9W9NS82_9EURO|nr:uncharacterized protein N7468_008560 [Penicillium chermesinum]KAJ5224018.1 hypothetical protein N7468_008560 [Penicillium chermesinum]